MRNVSSASESWKDVQGGWTIFGPVTEVLNLCGGTEALLSPTAATTEALAHLKSRRQDERISPSFLLSQPIYDFGES